MDYPKVQQIVIDECRTALSKVSEEQVTALVDVLLEADKVFIVGVGRVKLSLAAFSKRLVHLGIDAHVVGDINEPAMKKDDVLIVGSGSGESLVPVAIAKKAKSLGGKIVHIGSNKNSSLAPITDLMIRIPVQTKLYLEDEIPSVQPMSSLFEQCVFLLGDCVAMMIMDRKKFEIKKLWEFHANLE